MENELIASALNRMQIRSNKLKTTVCHVVTLLAF